MKMAHKNKKTLLESPFGIPTVSIKDLRPNLTELKLALHGYMSIIFQTDTKSIVYRNKKGNRTVAIAFVKSWD